MVKHKGVSKISRSYRTHNTYVSFNETFGNNIYIHKKWITISINALFALKLFQ